MPALPVRRPAACSARWAFACWPALLLGSAQAATAPSPDLAELSLEQLADVRVTSVTGRPIAAQEAAASIYVITGEDIRRSAATTLPEALRLAPNLQVARLNAGQYAISARGFNNAIGNKLLVLIDGRTVYSPLFSGVFWDEQDLLLDDIDRIEVISGPGATLWGSNAVNGVINVITKSAGATTGTLASATAGGEGSQVAVRYGARSDDGNAAWRLYAQRLNRNNTVRRDGTERPDASSKEQLGFRTDWAHGNAEATLQGGTYHAGRDASSNLAPKLAEGHLLARWSQREADGANWQLQAYYDRASREDDVLFNERTETLDLQFNHVPVTSPLHRVIWGAGYRRAKSETLPNRLVVFDPLDRTLAWSNLFVQDELHPSDAWRATLGAKVETNVYTGAEFLPTARIAYDLGHQRSVWASLSRAVRAPSRVDRDFHFPGKAPYLIAGGPDFQSEVANVAELGWRAQADRWAASATVFHADYRRLRGGHAGPTDIENRASGHVDGLEAWGHFDVLRQWRLAAGFTTLHKSLEAAPGSGLTVTADLGDDPSAQWMLRSTADLGDGWDLDVTVRRVNALPQPAVEAYTATDLRLGWQLTPELSASVLVQNAFDPSHIEYNAPATASEIPRSAWLRVQWALR